ncbi:hypothetical protein SLEP1_g47518 [Rubroshorea leprosula]|uniref:Protein kinase domain-containing protein n=1 Tax=Rubroshorea leprosula TaxID=152421 RepID=A0AAV5LQS2_9ROSI|nr:hypothetical protein SLEP1_g47518 [Rubroshorea leprosula]
MIKVVDLDVNQGNYSSLPLYSLGIDKVTTDSNPYYFHPKEAHLFLNCGKPVNDIRYMDASSCIDATTLSKSKKRRHLSMYDSIEEFLQSHNNLMSVRYSYSNIKKLTNGFKEKLGEGGFGKVYKAVLKSGGLAAVKLLGKSKVTIQDYFSEVATIGRSHHVNVVKPSDRASMNKVVEMLEADLESLEMPPRPFEIYPYATEEDDAKMKTNSTNLSSYSSYDDIEIESESVSLIENGN